MIPGLAFDVAAADPLDRLAAHVATVATSPLAWAALGGGAAATAALSVSDADHEIRVAFQKNLGSKAFGDSMVMAGYGLPVLLPTSLYLGGVLVADRELRGAGAASLQAVLVACGFTGALKLATGRPFPAHGGDPRDPTRLEHPEYAREWNWFQPGGSLAWPSGHATCSFALAASLSAYWPDTPTVPLVLYPIATTISMGMLIGDHHWTSDVLVGAALGHVIGWSIGRSFRQDAEDARGNVAVAPAAIPGGWAVTISGPL